MDFFGLFGLIDVVIVVLFVIFFLVGWLKGFAQKGIYIVSGIVVILLTIIFSPVIANFCKQNHIIYDWIFNPINSFLTGKAGDLTEASTVEAVIAKTLGVSKEVASLLAGMIGESSEAIEVSTICANIADAIAVVILDIIIWIIISLIVGLIVGIIVLICKKLKKNGFINFIDHLLGGIVFVGYSAIIIVVIFGVIAIFIEKNLFPKEIIDFFVADMKLGEPVYRLSKEIYEYNFFAKILKLFIH